MDDMDNEDNLGQFIEEEDDRIRPIDTAPPQNPAPELPPEKPKSFLDVEEWPEEENKKENATPPVKRRNAYDDDAVTFINKGEYLDLLEKAPTLKNITIGVGWDQKAFEEEPVDVDLSLFLLDKNDMTRVDEDFIFYNNDKGCDGAIHHLMDSRTGAGEGDDENIFIDLNGIPFDIIKIVFVFSIYDPEIKGLHFGMVKNMFFSILNKDDGREITRYMLDPEDHKGGNGMLVATLLREGPKWIMEAAADTSNGGLAKIATKYGIIVKELQTTGKEAVGDTSLGEN